MWARVVNAALGIWLMAAPMVVGYATPARTNDHIIGALVAAISIIAISEVTRGLRWVNSLFALWLVLAPWVLRYDNSWLIVHSSLIGIIVWFVTAVRGPVTQQFGGGWSALWHDGRNSNGP